MRISVIAGARPNFIKIAPLMAAMREEAPDAIEPVLVHTGQHYDANMSDAFFRDLDLPAPDVHLGVGSGSHAEQTAKIMTAFEKACLDERPGMVLVVGDVNSTMACAIVAAKLGISVAHVEAGLRSFDRSMPEEINRVVTDAIADWLFVSEPSGVENLRREGKDPSRVFFTGNVMIDTLARYRPAAARSPIMGTLGAEPGQYGVVTLHRPSNVDRREVLEPLLGALSDLGKRLPLFFAIHPRTKGRIAEWGLGGCFSDPPASSTVIDPGPRLTREVRAARGATRAHTWQVCNGGATTRCDADRAVRRRERNGHSRASRPGLYWLDPLGYLDFLCLMDHARLVLTDSGGIQEETTALGVPCLTIRENTERPVTVTEGTNTLVGSDPRRLLAEAGAIVDGGGKRGRVPELWDGRAARRIANILKRAATP